MSAAGGSPGVHAPPLQPSLPATALVVLGTGQVGRALLERIGTGALAGVRLVAVANSRTAWADDRGLQLPQIRRDLARCPRVPGAGPARFDPDTLLPEAGRGTGVVVDATASDGIAARHAGWLRRGWHVVTANKLGAGAALERWQAIDDARRLAGTRYGDSATVGAGLPWLKALRDLRAGGERIGAVSGVLSGTLAWLLHHYDGSRPFRDLVEQARDLGCTEPDPWQDLSGQDVVRKLLILGRAAGWPLREADVAIEPLAGAPGDWPALEAALAQRLDTARTDDRVLRHVATIDGDGRARVGLQALPASHPLAGGGSACRLLLRCDRYATEPLLIQGPGAGAVVTAAALMDDLRTIARARPGARARSADPAPTGRPTPAGVGRCLATPCGPR